MWSLSDQGGVAFTKYWKCLKILKLQNCCKNRWIKMAGLYDQLHIMANYPTKYERYQTNDIRGVGFAKYNYVANARKLVQWSPERSHSAKKMRDVRTNELTYKHTKKELYLLILSSAGHNKYRTVIAIPNNISKS